MVESTFVDLTIMVNVAAPVLLLAAGMVFYFMVRRMRRQSSSLHAAEDNAVALEMEKMRHKASLLLSWAIFVVLLGLGMSSFIAGEAGGLVQVVIMVVGGVAGLVLMMKGLSVRQRINVLFKEHFVAVELGKVFSNLHYAPDECIPREELTGLGFFSCMDVVSGKDLIKAKYKGIAFAHSTLVVEEEYTESRNDNEGSSHTETCTRPVFRGCVIRFDFTSAFAGVVQVVGKSFPNVAVASQASWHKVAMNVAAFDEAFVVYTQKTEDALHTLTQHMVEGIMHLNTSINGPIALYYKGQSMYAFLATKRHAFSMSGSKTLQEEQKVLQQDIEYITKFLATICFGNQR